MRIFLGRMVYTSCKSMTCHAPLELTVSLSSHIKLGTWSFPLPLQSKEKGGGLDLPEGMAGPNMALLYFSGSVSFVTLKAKSFLRNHPC